MLARRASIAGSAGCSWSRPRLTAWPRRQRRAEDDGDHRRRAVRRRLHQVDVQLPIPFWVDPGRARGDRARHAVRRLAHHPHDGVEDHQAAAGRRLRGRDRRGAISLFTATHLGVPVSTTHTITGAIVGVGVDPAAVGGALGRRRPDRLGVGPHDPRRRGDRGASTYWHRRASTVRAIEVVAAASRAVTRQARP